MADPAAPSPEELIRRFERAWLAGQRPALEEFAGDPPSRDLLVELAHADLEFRIKAGDAARAADYFDRFPPLANDDTATDLIAAEYELRRRTDPALPFDAVASEDPQYRNLLEEVRARLTPPLPGTLPGPAGA